MQKIRNQFLFLILGLFVSAGFVSYVYAAEVAPKWTSNHGIIEIAKGQTGTVTVSATGGSNTKIVCTNCNKEVLVDHGDGTATLTWDTAKNPAEPKTYYTSIKAINKNDEKKYVTGKIYFKIVEDGIPVWIVNPVSVPVSLGSVGEAIVQVNMEAIFGCQPFSECGEGVEVTNLGGGKAKVTLDTTKLTQFAQILPVGIRAFSTENVFNTSDIMLKFKITDDEIPSWKSVPSVSVELGKVGQVEVEANNGSEVLIQCASGKCMKWETVQDLGNGKAMVKLDTSLLSPFPQKLPVTIEAVNKNNPSKTKQASVLFTIYDPAIPKWISSTKVTVEYGQVGKGEVEASGGNNTKIECAAGCTGVTIHDKGAGKADVFLDTKQLSATLPKPFTYPVSLKATNKSDDSKKTTGDLVFTVVAPGTVTTTAPTVSTTPPINCTVLVEGMACDKPENKKKCEDTCTQKGEGQCAWTGSACKSKDQISQQEAAKMYQDKFYQKPAGYTGPLPDCAFTGDCRDVNDLLGFAIRVGQWIFRLTGSIAFVMFIFGGLTMVVSGGNSEKVKKGRDILAAAVVGLVIIFGAYLLVSFLLDTIGVNSDFDFRKAKTSYHLPVSSDITFLV